VLLPAYFQLCNPHSSPLYLKSSNISTEFFEGTGTADSTLHNKIMYISTHTHTHSLTHTHAHTNTLSVYRRGNRKKLLFLKKTETIKLIKKETTIQ